MIKLQLFFAWWYCYFPLIPFTREPMLCATSLVATSVSTSKPCSPVALRPCLWLFSLHLLDHRVKSVSCSYYLCFNQWLLELSPADYGFPSYLQPWLLMCYPTLHCSWGLQRTPSWVKGYYMLYIRILKLFKKGFGTEGSTVAVGLDVELCSVCW